MAEFPNISRITCTTQQNSLAKQAKEEVILNKAIRQDCLKPLDMLFVNALSPLFFYSIFYFSYSFLKT